MIHYHDLQLKKLKDGTEIAVKGHQVSLEPIDVPFIVPDGFDLLWLPLWAKCDNALVWTGSDGKWHGDKMDYDKTCALAVRRDFKEGQYL